MRVSPRSRTAVLVFLGYLLVFYGVWAITGVDYTRIGDTADPVLTWYLAPLAFGAVFLVIAVTSLSWWRPALFETERAAPRWLLIGPALMAVAAVITLVTSDKSKTTPNMFWLILIGSLLVGFCEELATRGVLITGFRAAWTEPKIWFVSTLLFALLHLPNWVGAVKGSAPEDRRVVAEVGSRDPGVVDGEQRRRCADHRIGTDRRGRRRRDVRSLFDR